MEVCVTLKKMPLALIPPLQSLFLMVETFSPVACWKSFCRSLVILLLFWWSPAALSSSSRVIEGLLIPLRVCRETHKPYWDHLYGRFILEELGRLCNLKGMQVPSHASSSEKDTDRTQKCRPISQGGHVPTPYPTIPCLGVVFFCFSISSVVVSGQIELLRWSVPFIFWAVFCIQSGWNVNDAVPPHTLMTSQLGDVWMWLCLSRHCRGGLFSRSECGTKCLFICVLFQTNRFQWLCFICSLKVQHHVLLLETC